MYAFCITELEVVGPSEVTVGTSANLTCRTTCFLPHAAVWYRNGVLFKTTSGMLSLNQVSIEDAAKYSCALSGYEHLRSPAQTLVVRCEFYLLVSKALPRGISGEQFCWTLY